MTEWKAAGRAPKDADDALWQAFRAAQDKFFSRRSAVFNERDAELTDNARRKEELLAEFFQQFLDLRGGDAGPALDQIFDRAKLLDQLDRRLLADATDARDVVRHVADQSFQIHRLHRLEPIALADSVGGVEHGLRHTAFAGEHVDVVVHQLQRVQVAGHDRAVQALVAGLGHQRADDVIGFHALELIDRDAEGAHDVAGEWKLVRQLGWGRPPVGLVLLQLLVPEGPPAQIEGRQHVIGVLLEGQQQHGGEPVGGVDHAPVPVGQ